MIAVVFYLVPHIWLSSAHTCQIDPMRSISLYCHPASRCSVALNTCRKRPRSLAWHRGSRCVPGLGTWFCFFLSYWLRSCLCDLASGWLSGQESICQCWRLRFDTSVGKIPWRRAWQPTPVFLPGKSHGQRSLEGYSLWGHKELDTT